MIFTYSNIIKYNSVFKDLKVIKLCCLTSPVALPNLLGWLIMFGVTVVFSIAVHCVAILWCGSRV